MDIKREKLPFFSEMTKRRSVRQCSPPDTKGLSAAGANEAESRATQTSRENQERGLTAWVPIPGSPHVPGSLKLSAVLLGITISPPRRTHRRHRPNIYVLLKALRVVIHFLALINILRKQSPNRQGREVNSEKRVKGEETWRHSSIREEKEPRFMKTWPV